VSEAERRLQEDLAHITPVTSGACREGRHVSCTMDGPVVGTDGYVFARLAPCCCTCHLVMVAGV
jgi:hypothetical protein